MSPALQAYVPPHIKLVLDRLHADEPDDTIRRDAAAVISAFVAAATPENVAVCLSTNTASRAGVTVQLSPNQAVMLHQLALAFPSTVTVASLHTAIWGASTERSINTVRVMLTELRKRVAALKVLLPNQSGFGYRLELQPITSEVT